MDDHDVLGFLLQMKNLAKEARCRGRRVPYTEIHRGKAIEFLSQVEGLGGTLEDAAELMSMHRATLTQWLDWYTSPGSPRVNVQVNVNLGRGF